MDVHYLIAISSISIPITPVNLKYMVLEMTIALCVQKHPNLYQQCSANPCTALMFSPAGLGVATPGAPR